MKHTTGSETSTMATRTKFGAETSSFADIMASVIQGPSLGPASFIVKVADLRPLQPGNVIIKFADDTYLVIPAIQH